MKQKALFDLLSKWLEEDDGSDVDPDFAQQLRDLEAEPVRFREIETSS